MNEHLYKILHDSDLKDLLNAGYKSFEYTSGNLRCSKSNDFNTDLGPTKLVKSIPRKNIFKLVCEIAQLYGEEFNRKQYYRLAIDNSNLRILAQYMDDTDTMTMILNVKQQHQRITNNKPENRTRRTQNITAKQPKFKGFCLETGQWHFGHGWYLDDYTEEYKQTHNETDKAILYTDSSPVACEVNSMGQFTGEILNNQEIYYGDIIHVEKLTFNSSAPLPENLNVGYYGGMYQLFRGDECLMGLDLAYIEQGEVIGTMYENPELVGT